MQKLTHTIVLALGVALGVGGSIAANSTVDRCRVVVLNDLQKSTQFNAKLQGYVGQADFLTTLSNASK
jgi:hypothetical protein